jgi:hypothetical protein
MQKKDRRLQPELINAFESLLCEDGFLQSEALYRHRNRTECVRSDLIQERLEAEGKDQLVDDVRTALEELAQRESDLQDAGFALDADDHLVYNGASKSLQTDIEREVAKQIGTEDDVRKRFAKALTDFSHVSTLKEAAGILTKLLAQQN